MNANRYLNSQKGKVVELMKVAYLAGKHIIVLEKIDDTLLREIIIDSAIIPYSINPVPPKGLSVVSDYTSSVQFASSPGFISTKVSDLPQKPTMYIYRCKDSTKSSSPQMRTESSFPVETLSTYLDHICGISELSSPSVSSINIDSLRNSLIVLTTNSSLDVPTQFSPYTEYIRVPYLTFDEFAEVSSVLISRLDKLSLVESESGFFCIDHPNSHKFLSRLFDNIKGVSRRQIEAILSKAKVERGCIFSDREEQISSLLSYVREEANKIISLSNALSIIDTSNASEPAGLGNMSTWIKKNKEIIRNGSLFESMEMHVPKGILVSGIPGTGKSMMAMYIAKELDLPLVRFDFGDVHGGFVGDSERNMNESLATIDALAPCVVWVDEMEKAFNNSNSTHETTRRLIGKFLTWMQEKKSLSFVFATANDISCMPPEMFRSGRFDEKFYTFLPSAKECGQIFESIINHQNMLHRKRTAKNFEALPLFSQEINANMFVSLLNSEDNMCILEKQDLSDKNISRRNKFFIGSDIAKLIEDTKSLYISHEGFVNSFDYDLFLRYLVATLRQFKTYGETNLNDVAKCYSKLAKANFVSACNKESVILPFDGYDELNCQNGREIYTGQIQHSLALYDKQMFISVRNTLNSLGKALLDK